MNRDVQNAAPGLKQRGQRVVEWVLSSKPVRAFLLYQEHHGPMLADSVTYRVLFSLFAGVFLGFAILGLWLSANQEAMNALIATLQNAVPGLIGEGGVINPATVVRPITFEIAGIFALFGLVAAMIGSMASLRVAFRRIADRADDTTFPLLLLLRDLGLAIGFGVAFIAASAITFFSTAALGTVFDWFGWSQRSDFYLVAARGISILVIFVIDTLIVAVMFPLLSGVRPAPRSLWSGAIIGGVGLTGLQVLSGLFVGGASANPLLASFGTLIALLLWLNFSSQVILLAAAYIMVGVEEERDRVHARFGATSFALRRLRRAERRARQGADDLAEARAAVEQARSAVERTLR